jgi:hypothetical protein
LSRKADYDLPKFMKIMTAGKENGCEQFILHLYSRS